MRVKRGEYGAAPECQGGVGGETGDRRGNPPTSGIVRHESHVRESEAIEPGSSRWEASGLTTTPPAAVAERLACSPPTKASRAQSPDDAVGRGVFSGIIPMDRVQDPKWDNWYKEQMIIAVKAGTTGYRSAAKQFGVSNSTVESYLYECPSIDSVAKGEKIELGDGAPAGAIWGCHPSGWIQGELFAKWVVSGVVWTNRTMVSSRTDTNRTGVLAVVDIANGRLGKETSSESHTANDWSNTDYCLGKQPADTQLRGSSVHRTVESSLQHWDTSHAARASGRGGGWKVRQIGGVKKQEKGSLGRVDLQPALEKGRTGSWRDWQKLPCTAVTIGAKVTRGGHQRFKSSTPPPPAPPPSPPTPQPFNSPTGIVSFREKISTQVMFQNTVGSFTYLDWLDCVFARVNCPAHESLRSCADDAEFFWSRQQPMTVEKLLLVAYSVEVYPVPVFSRENSPPLVVSNRLLVLHIGHLNAVVQSTFYRLPSGYGFLLRAPSMYSTEQEPAYLATLHHTPLGMVLITSLDQALAERPALSHPQTLNQDTSLNVITHCERQLRNPPPPNWPVNGAEILNNEPDIGQFNTGSGVFCHRGSGPRRNGDGHVRPSLTASYNQSPATWTRRRNILIVELQQGFSKVRSNRKWTIECFPDMTRAYCSAGKCGVEGEETTNRLYRQLGVRADCIVATPISSPTEWRPLSFSVVTPTKMEDPRRPLCCSPAKHEPNTTAGNTVNEVFVVEILSSKTSRVGGVPIYDYSSSYGIMDKNDIVWSNAGIRRWGKWENPEKTRRSATSPHDSHMRKNRERPRRESSPSRTLTCALAVWRLLRFSPPICCDENRPRGKPRLIWLDAIKEDVRKADIPEEEWRDRALWRRLVSEAMDRLWSVMPLR
ncbi:hypothetical protein PR048_033308 [Dryococelus australis]|uniref:Transposase n=1 Tax=Dryococelus australis TaxID=614101 RepID=A0ABQ9G439_9NEOP|nr:hypothetical protein PR048_033308 [Dryococelus australis]